MNPVIPWYITVIVLAVNAGAAIAVWRIFRFRTGGAVILGAWLGAALLLAPPMASLATADPSRLNPLIPVFGAGSIALALAAAAFSPAARRALASASVPALVGVQVYRAIGLVFLVLLASGQLPAHFAKPAGWGDIVIGLTAPFVALALARGRRGARALAIAWNTIGLLDLAIAVGMGTGLLAGTGPAGPMGAFPLFIIPAFIVPLSVLLHLAVLARLLRDAPVRPGLEANAIARFG